MKFCLLKRNGANGWDIMSWKIGSCTIIFISIHVLDDNSISFENQSVRDHPLTLSIDQTCTLLICQSPYSHSLAVFVSPSVSQLISQAAGAHSVRQSGSVSPTDRLSLCLCKSVCGSLRDNDGGSRSVNRSVVLWWFCLRSPVTVQHKAIQSKLRATAAEEQRHNPLVDRISGPRKETRFHLTVNLWCVSLISYGRPSKISCQCAGRYERSMCGYGGHLSIQWNSRAQ